MKSIFEKHRKILAFALSLLLAVSLAVCASAEREIIIVDFEETTAQQTEPVTEPATEPQTEPSTETPTEPQTEPVSQPATEHSEQHSEKTTEKPTEAPTAKPTEPREEPGTVTPTAKPTEPPTTKQSYIYIPTIRPPQEQEYEEETEPELEDGAFYVYLELNNSEPRLKHILKEPGLVPEPDEPAREGYVFDGWYADEEFTTSWNFFTDTAYEGTVIYAKWIADANTVEYAVNVVQTAGGTLKVHPARARAGETIIITASPEDGKRLVFGSVTVNGESTQVLNFIMPAKDVTVQGVFENIPVVTKEEKDYSKMFYASLSVIIILIIVSAAVVIRRKRIFKAMENEELPEWHDETAVVEAGFKGGQKVKEEQPSENEFDPTVFNDLDD